MHGKAYPASRPLVLGGAFLGGFALSTHIVGNSKEFFHLLRNTGQYSHEFKLVYDELYYPTH